jgi:hypothetical protein
MTVPRMNPGTSLRITGDRIVSVLEAKRWAGLRIQARHGDVIFFVDSEDALLETTVATALPFLSDPARRRCTGRSGLTDAEGRRTGEIVPRSQSDSDMRDATPRAGVICSVRRIRCVWRDGARIAEVTNGLYDDVRSAAS